MQKRERKSEKNNAKINERKKAKEARNYTQALGELKCAYIKKKLLKFRIEQIAVLEAF